MSDLPQTDYEIGQDNVNPFGLDIHNPVFVISGLTIVLFTLYTLMFQAQAEEFFGWLRPAITTPSLVFGTLGAELATCRRMTIQARPATSRPMMAAVGKLTLQSVAKCNDIACMGGNETISTVDDPPSNAGFQTSITIGDDGRPVISYWQYDPAGAKLKVTRCGNPACDD